MARRDIVAVNRTELAALTDDGVIGTITNLFDADGSETDDAMEAVSAVVRVSGHEWFAVVLADYDPVQMH